MTTEKIDHRYKIPLEEFEKTFKLKGKLRYLSMNNRPEHGVDEKPTHIEVQTIEEIQI